MVNVAFSKCLGSAPLFLNFPDTTCTEYSVAADGAGIRLLFGVLPFIDKTQRSVVLIQNVRVTRGV